MRLSCQRLIQSILRFETFSLLKSCDDNVQMAVSQKNKMDKLEVGKLRGKSDDYYPHKKYNFNYKCSKVFFDLVHIAVLQKLGYQRYPPRLICKRF
jgi:hypothetical protein